MKISAACYHTCYNKANTYIQTYKALEEAGIVDVKPPQELSYFIITISGDSPSISDYKVRRINEQSESCMITFVLSDNEYILKEPVTLIPDK